MAAQCGAAQKREREDESAFRPAGPAASRPSGAKRRRSEEPRSILRLQSKKLDPSEDWEVTERQCIREGPDAATSGRLAMLQAGQWCTATELCGDQMKVRFKTNDGSDVVGWMTKNTRFMKKKYHLGLGGTIFWGAVNLVGTVASALMQGDPSKAQHQVMHNNGLSIGKRLTSPATGTARSHTFTIGKFLGAGTFAVVVTGNGPQGIPVALKVSKTDKPQMQESWKEQSQIEADILTDLRGKRGIVKCFQHFDCEQRHIIVLEECGSDLHSFASEQPDRKLDQKMAARVLHDLCGALSYVHAKQLVHTDIKLANLLLKNNTITFDPNEQQVVLCDFGSCARPSDARELAFGRPYRAPEVVYYETKRWGWQADIFAAGCVMVELVTDVDEQLFRSKRNKDHMNQLKTWREKVMSAGLWPNDEFPLEKIPVSLDCDFQARDKSNVHYKANKLCNFTHLRRMIFEMMNMYPHNRPSAKTLMDHPDMISLWQEAKTATAKYSVDW